MAYVALRSQDPFFLFSPEEFPDSLSGGVVLRMEWKEADPFLTLSVGFHDIRSGDRDRVWSDSQNNGIRYDCGVPVIARPHFNVSI